MTIASYTALSILGAFILPGYITRLLIGRRIALPQLDSVQLVLQSLTISFVLDTFVLLLWMGVAAFYHPTGPLGILHDVLLAPHLSTTADLLILVTAIVLVFATGIIIAVWECKFTDFLIQAVVTTGGAIRAIPMFYYLFSERPKLLGPNSQPWVDVEMTDGSRVVGRVHQYGLLPPDEQSLIVVEAEMTKPTDKTSTAIGFVYIPGRSIRYLEVAYTDSETGKPQKPWEPMTSDIISGSPKSSDHPSKAAE
jgi:hypothetical protein